MREWDPELRQSVSRETLKAQFRNYDKSFFLCYQISSYFHKYDMNWLLLKFMTFLLCVSVLTSALTTKPKSNCLNYSWKWQQIHGTQIPQGVSCTSRRLLLVWYISILTYTMRHLLHLPRAKWAWQSKQTAEEWTWTPGQIFGSCWSSPSGL